MSPYRLCANGRRVILAGTLCAGVLLFGGVPTPAQQRTVVMRPPVAVQPRQPVRAAQVPQGAHVVTNIAPVRSASRQHLQAHASDHGLGGHHGNGSRNFGCANSAGLTVQQLINPFPANGFNFEHLNAIDSDLAIKAAIDPATELALNEARRLNCGATGSGGYVLFGGGYGVPEEVVQDQADDSDSGSDAKPQVIVIQVPAAGAAPAESRPVAAAPREEEAPLPDVGPFVLVMRDGSQVQATAFTRSADQIVYISSDGLRHTVALAKIDADATIRLNSERGSQIQLSL